ncbi:MAG: sugar ABC transporter ATP-binding protein, partial [Caldilineaceae bacterium]|nr:sugar ABC transporter ATP-binding protein [Caldilineaceae bacterium]
ALVGANGSGKSTLSKIVTGVVAPDRGRLLLDGNPVTFASPHAARTQGVTAVYQELSLVPDMTVAENIWLTHEPRRGGVVVDQRAVEQRTRTLLDLFAGTVSPGLTPQSTIRHLPPDEKQIVEILKALSIDPRLIILDEATASLDNRQVSRLFELVEQWKAAGRAIVIVTHRMDEIFRIADRAVVLRNGNMVGDLPLSEVTEQTLVGLMTGQETTAPAAAIHAVVAGEMDAASQGGGVRLAVAQLQTNLLRGVDLDVRDGELVGLGGLRGQGQEDVLLAVYGALAFHGEIRVSGEPAKFTHPRQAMARGIAYVPGERNAQGLLSIRSILENLQLPSWNQYGLPLRMHRARTDAQRVADDLRMVMAGLDAPVDSLSGGNAQKVVLGKWLLRSPELLLLNDPTKGVDVGAKNEIYRLLADLRQAGTAILFYSSDDEELIGLCDRVLVLHDGAIEAELRGPTLTRANLVAASVGANQAAASTAASSVASTVASSVAHTVAPRQPRGQDE